MEIIKSKAFILNKIPIKEEDLLVILFTDNLGKIVAKAKGALKIYNKWLRILETLNLIETNIYKKREYYYLTESKVLDSFFKIKREFYKSDMAFKIINLIDKTQIENNPNNNIFNLFLNTLNFMKIYKSLDTIFLGFLWNLLRYEGVLFSLDKCAKCGKLLTDYIYYSSQIDGFLCEQERVTKSLKFKKDTLISLQNFLNLNPDNFYISNDEKLNIFVMLNQILLNHFSFSLPNDFFLFYVYN